MEVEMISRKRMLHIGNICHSRRKENDYDYDR